MTEKEFVIDSFCAWDGDTLVLNILGKPGSNRDAICKVKGKQLKVSVTASPVRAKQPITWSGFLQKNSECRSRILRLC